MTGWTADDIATPSPFGGGGRSTEDLGVAVEAPARVDERTRDILTRIRPGEIAVIDHEDLDRKTAEDLVRARVAAVVNASDTVSGRYPNMGPLLLVVAGIPLVDGCGRDLLQSVEEGVDVRVAGGNVYVAGKAVAHGSVQTIDSLESKLEEAKHHLAVELQAFAESTIEFLREERDLPIEGVSTPDSRVDFDGRQCVVVVRNYDWRQDLEVLLPYIRDRKPVLIGVDGGADALREAGLRPDIIIGDPNSVGADTLTCGAELVVHAGAEARPGGVGRLEDLGIAYATFTSRGTAADAAMLLAYEKGAELVVAVGTQASPVEFIERGTAGAATSLLTRMRVGPVLADAKAVQRLYQPGLRPRHLAALIAAAILTLLVVVAISQPFQLFFQGIGNWIADIWHSLFG